MFVRNVCAPDDTVLKTCVTKVNVGGRVLTAGDRFQGREVTIGVNRRLPKEQITIHIKTHPQLLLNQVFFCLCLAVFQGVFSRKLFELIF